MGIVEVEPAVDGLQEVFVLGPFIFIGEKNGQEHRFVSRTPFPLVTAAVNEKIGDTVGIFPLVHECQRMFRVRTQQIQSAQAETCQLEAVSLDVFMKNRGGFEVAVFFVLEFLDTANPPGLFGRRETVNPAKKVQIEDRKTRTENCRVRIGRKREYRVFLRPA
jgi:hypothetical protein